MTMRPWQRRGLLLAGALAACWIVFAIDAVTPGSFAGFGIRPRSVAGLQGVFVAPFLHGNLAHLVANSMPFLVLGGLVMLQGERRFLLVTLWSVLGAGIVAWLLGAPHSVHIGASGVVFGYLGFLLSHGWFVRNVRLMLLSIAVAFLWGGLVFGVLPGQPGVSWQAHAGGFAAGLLAARGLAPRRAKPASTTRRR